MKFKMVALLIFLCGLTLFSVSMIQSKRAETIAPKTPRSFVVHYLASRADNGGPLKPYEYRVRAVNSMGEWKETRYSFDGKVSTWGAAKDGLQIISGNSRQYYGEYNPEVAKTAMRSEEVLKKHPQLTRIEEIAGLKTYILRNEYGDEAGYSPETGVTTLKEVARSGPGSDTIIHLQEALNVEFRELSENEVRLPDLPIRFDLAQQKAQALRAAGHHERADALEQGISKLKANSK
ncbi:MAG TPA: hypothetical protein VNO70_03245 [Blastocatellia bacterium]|nr:hypothetical protein [Blastocatellia bacterium]